VVARAPKRPAGGLEREDGVGAGRQRVVGVALRRHREIDVGSPDLDAGLAQGGPPVVERTEEGNPAHRYGREQPGVGGP
jgi:hypothetical protein